VPFPLHPSKVAAPALVTARDFRRYVGRVGAPRAPCPASVVVVFAPRLVRRAVAVHHARPVEGHPAVYSVGTGRCSVGVAQARGVGGPSVAITVEELVAWGARRFVVVGFAGAIADDLAVGDRVLCSRAARDEGTSHHYARPSKWAHPTRSLCSALGDELRARGLDYRSGSSWTIDAPYRETAAEVRRWRHEGVETVEMEASALFTVARALGVESAALFVVSDHLRETGWEPRFAEARPALDALLSFAVGALPRLVPPAPRRPVRGPGTAPERRARRAAESNVQ
jgi:uridine phosphorylase